MSFFNIFNSTLVGLITFCLPPLNATPIIIVSLDGTFIPFTSERYFHYRQQVFKLTTKGIDFWLQVLPVLMEWYYCLMEVLLASPISEQIQTEIC